jgi:hypothetical protein
MDAAHGLPLEAVMKNSLVWLAAIGLMAVPFTAAAFDYDANSSLLAAAGPRATQLPGTPAALATVGVTPVHSAADPADSDPAADPAAGNGNADVHEVSPRPAPSRDSSAAASNPRHSPPASIKPNGVLPLRPSWRSLLPGSIY